jgi:hypothetical protein
MEQEKSLGEYYQIGKPSGRKSFKAWRKRYVKARSSQIDLDQWMTSREISFLLLSELKIQVFNFHIGIP